MPQLLSPARPIQSPPAELVSDLWLRLSGSVPFAVAEDEIHYLRVVALGLDDDLASLLLLKKLKLSRKLPSDAVPEDLVVMNSVVEFRFGDENLRIGQLLHPSVSEGQNAISIGSRLGAGLIGLRAGQAMFWPSESGELRPLQVVTARPSRGGRVQTLARPVEAASVGGRRGANDDAPPPTAA